MEFSLQGRAKATLVRAIPATRATDSFSSRAQHRAIVTFNLAWHTIRHVWRGALT